jgi:hypothetical protein
MRERHVRAPVAVVVGRHRHDDGRCGEAVIHVQQLEPIARVVCEAVDRGAGPIGFGGCPFPGRT